MTNNDAIVMIYDYKEGADLKPSAYYLYHAFDENGLIDLDAMVEVYEEFINQTPETSKLPLGPFDNLTFLNQFAFKVCEKIDNSLVSLISVKDYNSILEEATTGDDLFQNLTEKGNRIENLDHSSKSSLLGKFFH
jgi:hypothetical protein